MKHKKKHIVILAVPLALILSACTTRSVMFTSRQAADDYYAQGGKPGSPSVHITRPFIRYPGPAETQKMQTADNQEEKDGL